MLMGLALVTLGWLPFSRVTLQLTSLAVPLAFAVGMMLAAWYYRWRRHEPKLSTVLDLLISAEK